MNVLLVYAHPEPRSLNGTLRDFTVARLRAAGHTVQVSDLHAMRWKAVLDTEDFPQREAGEPFNPGKASKQAFAAGTQTGDVAAEQEKLRWADLAIFQFPMWWFSMPAILKGWFDRVYAYGFGYGVGEHSAAHWGDRYGEGALLGKRAMLVVTTGGWAEHYSERGINGPIDDLLFPIQHGMLFYPGFAVLPPFVIHKTGSMDAQRLDATLQALGVRLDAVSHTAPIPYRRQNHGDYLIPALTLKPDLSPGRSGFALHRELPEEAGAPSRGSQAHDAPAVSFPIHS
ncbi:NAD(P)H-dependent oxidoreductase [Pandoraea sp.]|uniref:NAD(P)H-dependent oxidoreductase n=1 Tax=Pandoraea sp. TaxID=1883445 RepID=UPI0012206254|nr:NAD(P)H-dependent oxidoreductase [Pandoraea sp.]TAL56810.1 MAG: flavodoxin family protein [Pandoraea sp.]TAM15636.1 MAG: flavodoxin family protein [Pandoraea sp.]